MSIFIERGQIMTKGKKLGSLAVIFTVFALLLTVAFSVNDKKEAKAYFKRISLKKCAISLSANYYDWSGKEIRPAVTVKYNGVDLVKNKDYTLEYKDNLDAGEGRVVVKGIGNYRDSKTLRFTIKGIDIESDCTHKINGSSVYVYYKDQLVDPSNYKITSSVSEYPTYRFGDTQEYLVITTYTVRGRGQYSGYFTYETKKTIYKYEPVCQE